MTELFDDADVVFRYTRRQAIEDGVLVDLMNGDWGAVVRERGFWVPIAMTRAAFAETVEVTEGMKEFGQDEVGRLWDILNVLRVQVRKTDVGESVVRFRVRVAGSNGRARNVDLKAMIGPDDEGNPCLTILLPDED